MAVPKTEPNGITLFYCSLCPLVYTSAEAALEHYEDPGCRGTPRVGTLIKASSETCLWCGTLRPHGTTLTEHRELCAKRPLPTGYTPLPISAPRPHNDPPSYLLPSTIQPTPVYGLSPHGTNPICDDLSNTKPHVPSNIVTVRLPDVSVTHENKPLTPTSTVALDLPVVSSPLSTNDPVSSEGAQPERHSLTSGSCLTPLNLPTMDINLVTGTTTLKQSSSGLFASSSKKRGRREYLSGGEEELTKREMSGKSSAPPKRTRQSSPAKEQQAGPAFSDVNSETQTLPLDPFKLSNPTWSECLY